jgi:hypothetical protein
MSENKPLLFIETVQTKINENIGQTYFDSRSMKKETVIDQEPLVPKELNKAKGSKPLDRDEEKERSSKIAHQAKLLDKRAKQEHYVYVQINLIEGESFTGFFKGLSNNVISLKEEEEMREIDLSDVLEITILKV